METKRDLHRSGRVLSKKGKKKEEDGSADALGP
jgi:hypothetical protein